MGIPASTPVEETSSNTDSHAGEDLNTAVTQATATGGQAKGTAAYMAPELLEANIFTQKTDVYAFGLIIWEVLTGEIPWAGLNGMQIGMKLLAQNARPPVPDGAPDDLVQLMTRCWAREPERRPAFDAARHTHNRRSSRVATRTETPAPAARAAKPSTPCGPCSRSATRARRRTASCCCMSSTLESGSRHATFASAPDSEMRLALLEAMRALHDALTSEASGYPDYCLQSRAPGRDAGYECAPTRTPPTRR